MMAATRFPSSILACRVFDGSRTSVPRSIGWVPFKFACGTRTSRTVERRSPSLAAQFRAAEEAWAASTGITQLQRYQEPLRRPSAPGLSLTGVRLIIPNHALGFPVLRALSSIPLSGQLAHRPFRDLLGVHSRCGLHTRAVTKFVTAIRGLQTFRHLHTCPGCFSAGAIAGWALHPLENAALSRRKWKPVLA